MAEQSPDPWRVTWRFATSNGALVALLLAMAVSVTLTAWIPQQPSSDAEYARWLSQVQARFGEATSLVQAAGLFNIVPSVGFRVLLALLAGCVFVRFVEGVDRLRRDRQIDEPSDGWKQVTQQPFEPLLSSLRRRRYRVAHASSVFQVDRWPWSDMLPLVAHFGTLLLLMGLLFSHLFGWQVEDLTLQKGERQSLPGAGNWVTLSENGDAVRASSGVVAFVEERGPGVQASAVDPDGHPLQLLLAPDGAPTTTLMVALTDDAYFAVPDAELIVRLTPQSEQAYARTDIQVYSSPTGDVISEEVTEKGGQAELNVRGVILTFAPAPYADVTTTRNPGRLPAGLGVGLLMVGLIGNLAWPERRFWVRQGEGSVEAAGDIPSWLRDEEADL